MTLQPRSHVRILTYRTWTIQNELKLLLAPCKYIFKFIRDLQQQRRLRKRHLKSEFALILTLSRFSDSFYSSNVGKFFWS